MLSWYSGKRLISLICSLLISIFSIGKVYADVLAFPVHYAIVNHTIKNDSGEIDKLMKLNDLGEISEHKLVGNFLSDFWWNRAVMSCHSYVKEAWESQKAVIKTEEIKKFITNTNDKCVQSYIYDNWDEINTTIVGKYNYLNTKINEKKSFWAKVKGYLWADRS